VQPWQMLQDAQQQLLPQFEMARRIAHATAPGHDAHELGIARHQQRPDFGVASLPPPDVVAIAGECW
jgi:hypothetical protein